MATVLLAPVTCNLAETTRATEVARALAPRHRVVVMGYESTYARHITDAGLDYRPLEPAWTLRQQRQAIAFDQGRTIRHPFSRSLVDARIDAERSLIGEVGADAVVMLTNLTSLISARAARVPLLYPVPFALTRPHVAQTPSLGLVRGRTPWAHGADRAVSAAMRWTYNRAPLAPRAFARAARAHGVRPLRTIASLLEADWNLLTVLEPELAGYDLPPGYVRVGPIFAHLPGQVPAVIRQLAATDAKLVYLALGSSGNRKLALGAARALGEVDAHVVAPIRHFLTPADEAGLPPNVTVTPLLPAHLLGGLVDAAVLHGGQGSVQTACASGVPFVGMGLQPEQAWNVAVCERAGNAIALRPADVGTPLFTAAVRRVLYDERIRAAADRVRRDYEGEDGATATAAVVEDVLVGRRPPQ